MEIAPQPEIAKKRKRIQAKEGKVVTTHHSRSFGKGYLKKPRQEKEKSSKKCCKDVTDVMIVTDHEEQEDNEISDEEDDTAYSIVEKMWRLCMLQMCISGHNRFR